jgi:hypothetical protein
MGEENSHRPAVIRISALREEKTPDGPIGNTVGLAVRGDSIFSAPGASASRPEDVPLGRAIERLDAKRQSSVGPIRMRRPRGSIRRHGIGSLDLTAALKKFEGVFGEHLGPPIHLRARCRALSRGREVFSW